MLHALISNAADVAMPLAQAGAPVAMVAAVFAMAFALQAAAIASPLCLAFAILTHRSR